MLYQSTGKPLDQLAHTNVQCTSGGALTWSRPGAMKGASHFDLKKFPYDTQEVELQLGSWKYDEGSLALTAKVDQIDMANYIGDHEWSLTQSRTEVAAAAV